MKIKKAIIPAAGLGTRVLPASKAVPKEMLNIVDKPAIQYIVEEAFAAGIEDVLIITNRGKGVIEDHFDHAIELEHKLAADPNKADLYRDVLQCSQMGNIYFIRQKETKGLGHAVLCAKNFVGNEPFAVLYGDDVIISDDPVTGQLCRVYEKYGKGAVGVKEVPTADITKYCSLAVAPLEGNCFTCTDMIEKPRPEQVMSNYSILGRVVLPPSIFEILEHTPNGAGGELQLTDAMRTLARQEGVVAVDYNGTRYDMGNKFGILQANIEVGLQHPETGARLKEYIKNLAILMIKLERTSVTNFDNAMRGARNPMNSWGRYDSYYDEDGNFVFGPNDLNLAKRLCKAGTDHRKFIRMIFVTVDVTAPMYWWKEYDTYKVGTVANSTSTMHKIASKPFELADFSVDHMDQRGLDAMEKVIRTLEQLRLEYLETKDKQTWYTMIQLLPSSYNQMRTCTLNYETLANIYFARRSHKLDEWHTYCDWALELPYFKTLIADTKD